MRILNQTKNTVLAENAVIADTPLKRMRGLLGRKALASGEALILKPCNSIHTFFMRFAIDAVFVDKNNRVAKTLSSIKPFRASSIYWQANYCVELPAGVIASTQTIPGDTILLAR